MNLTRSALASSRLTLFTALLVLVGGVLTFLNFPSQEEPSVTIRDAVVQLAYPGMPTEKVETLLARPVEENLRSLAGIKKIVTTVRPGSAILQITAHDSVADLPALWLRVRAKAAEVGGALPAGTMGPFVDDDFGRVSVASIAVTAPGFSMSEMRGPLRKMREQLYTLPGVERVSLYGLQEDRIYIAFDRVRLVEAGLSPASVIDQLRRQNVVVPGGLVSASGMAMTVATSGEVGNVQALKQVLINTQGSGGAREIALGALAQVQVMPADPPETAAIYQGQPAVVVAVSMASGYNVVSFGKALREKLVETASLLPTGFQQHVVTFQADVVDREMSKMHQVMGETVVIVMAVVMLFLGWRTGLIVGAIVPLTILGSLILMRVLNVELQTVSIAAIILALGLLVDNGIVIAEDIERRLMAGEERFHACVEAGRTLAIPLLTSSLVIVLAFSPFFFGQTSTNEYMRSLAVVLAITLLGSWLLSITVTPLLCLYFARAHAGEHNEDNYNSKFYRAYRAVIERLLEFKLLFISTMLLALGGAVVVLSSIPYDFLPKSDRLQFQIPVTLRAGADSRQTLQSVETMSRWLADKRANPEIVDSIGYVADGGPRIVLGLNPPLPGSNIAYFTVSVKPKTDIDQVIDRVRQYVRKTLPDVRAEPKRFSLGATEAGVAVYRVTGADEQVLRTAADQIADALRSLPGTLDVTDDWQARIPRYIVQVDQLKARRAGVSSDDIAQALQLRYSGVPASQIRDDGVDVPILLRGDAGERAGNGSPADTLVYPQSGGKPLPLSAIASIQHDSEPSTLMRRNLERAITVTGRNPDSTTSEMVAALADKIAKITLPPGYRIELGGEIEDSAEANQALLEYMPHALGAILLLFIWQFNSFRKLFIVVSAIPFVLIGAALALLVTGYPFGFMATFGLLALAGIIVNNAVLLLERIEAELAEGLPRREAVISAAVKRLRPIVMTKLTCIVGLIPLMLFAGPLWTGMAITMIGGLALGTLVTLGMIPILYDVLFGLRLLERDKSVP
ncbi:efflux RND transporter permease subunit [Xanthomonas phaseoli]|uniref:Acriflavin resistance protein n=3 Tax=Xanthomonas TaxID=338 RepID=A0A1V9HBA1_9XANT|nr:efflux RND transporter permease subunit [Xanthomonas phaseoli]MBO9790176.1 efflux RND transporter permease subunit [Xanthomonas phaseoli pv. dieffenbachiae]MBO9833025.1 efflux RND transporter permease subunit [Xanthomonas phaseoli pv. dieffenbachiae]MBO9838456.1 efflux RND transporter permease subunit [Xanthomonas phaseoli pv. dieffenbachiae]MBO9842950.1 efflux RND transporter permease subunit [Xanthomonas phaseoli pv. dieffenbachiae]MBO9863312.1 efflux RND transporter permease subunit [Xan